MDDKLRKLPDVSPYQKFVTFINNLNEKCRVES